MYVVIGQLIWPFTLTTWAQSLPHTSESPAATATKGVLSLSTTASTTSTTTAVADDDWGKLPYFVSTSKTGFSMVFLERFDAELLLGQVSYKQKSDIYNFYNKYEKTQKRCQTKATSTNDSDDDECRYIHVKLLHYLHSSTSASDVFFTHPVLFYLHNNLHA